MPIKAKQLGSKKGIERSLKGGSGKYALRVPAEGVTVRFITEPERWFEAQLHFDERRKTSYPCVGIEDGCIACEEGQEARSRWFANVYSIDEDRVSPFEMPKSVVKLLYKKYDRYNTIMDRNYEITKEGTGLNTEYEVDALAAEHMRGLDEMEGPDLMDFLNTMYDDAMRQITDGEETVSASGRSRGSKSSRRTKATRRRDLDDEDDFEDDDLEDEEEEAPKRRPNRAKAPRTVSKPPKRRTVRR